MVLTFKCTCGPVDKLQRSCKLTALAKLPGRSCCLLDAIHPGVSRLQKALGALWRLCILLDTFGWLYTSIPGN